MRAWSVAHGELLGHEFGPNNGPLNPFGPTRLPHAWDYGLSVRAPETYQNWAGIGCVAFDPRITANCLSLGNSTRTVPSLTYHGRYFPAYYLLVGLPSWVSSPGARQIYLMRLASVLLAAALLAVRGSSAHAARARVSVAASGLVLAITPMVLFFAASVNPSGLQIAAAIAVWTSGTLLAKTAADGIDSRLVDRLGVAAVALAIARPLGPLWLVITGVILALVAGFAGVRALWRSSWVRIWVGVIVGATVVTISVGTCGHRFVRLAALRRVAQSSEHLGDLRSRCTIGKGYSLLHSDGRRLRMVRTHRPRPRLLSSGCWQWARSSVWRSRALLLDAGCWPSDLLRDSQCSYRHCSKRCKRGSSVSNGKAAIRCRSPSTFPCLPGSASRTPC